MTPAAAGTAAATAAVAAFAKDAVGGEVVGERRKVFGETTIALGRAFRRTRAGIQRSRAEDDLPRLPARIPGYLTLDATRKRDQKEEEEIGEEEE